MDVKHTTIDKESVRREAAFIPDFSHTNESKPQDHMSTAAAPPPNVERALVVYREPKGRSSPAAPNAATKSPAVQDHSPQASFLGIPPELRLHIYQMLWTLTKEMFTTHVDQVTGKLSLRKRSRAQEDLNNTRTALLRVNKQIFQEATPVLQRTSDLSMMTDGVSLPPWFWNSSVIPAPEARITSICLRAQETGHRRITPSPALGQFFTHDRHPHVENLRFLVKIGHGMDWNQRSAMVTRWALGFADSPNLKSIAIEFSYSSYVERSYGDLMCQRFCDRLQRELREGYRLKGGKSAAIDVMWRWRTMFVGWD